MKRIPGMMNPLLARTLAVFVLGAAALAPIASADNRETIFHTVGNVPYVSGGVGLDSIDRLDTMAGQFCNRHFNSSFSPCLDPATFGT